MDYKQKEELCQVIKNLHKEAFNLNHRFLFYVYGKDAKYQILTFYNVLTNFLNNPKPSVLWCFRDFNENRDIFNLNLQYKQQDKKMSTKKSKEIYCPLEKFVVSENVRISDYRAIPKLVGNSYNMVILQDFYFLTPNLLAQIIEMVEGGGMVLFIVPQTSQLDELVALDMTIHSKYKTDSHPSIVPLFNRRFLLSLPSCHKCLVMNSQGTIHPTFMKLKDFVPKNKYKKSKSKKLPKNVADIIDDDMQKGLILLCKTYDQASALSKLMKTIENKFNKTVTLIAPRGRGKSATLGLSVAYAIVSKSLDILITAPHATNVNMLFMFIANGLNHLGYQEGEDYVKKYDTENVSIVGIKLLQNTSASVEFKEAYLIDTDFSADLLIIDEAAAIPLARVKRMLGRCPTFMSSTVCGYEGTGRSLSLKLIDELRRSSADAPECEKLEELTLEECIRYGKDDDVEKWLYTLLCLNTELTEPIPNLPLPDDCHLCYVNKMALFSFEPTAELFLQRVMSLYGAAHYRNSPNDLHMIMDGPMHHLFCLLPGPQSDFPICVVHVSFEGRNHAKSVKQGIQKSRRKDGDLIPWILTENFYTAKCKFFRLSGVRIVRIATHPSLQGKGYGTKALALLEDYFNRKFPFSPELEVQDPELTDLNQRLVPSSCGQLLYQLHNRPAEEVDYLGVSYGASQQLLRFWKSSGFMPLYVRNKPNALTGEHTCIMIKPTQSSQKTQQFVAENYPFFERRFLKDLPRTSLSIHIAHSIISNPHSKSLRRTSLTREMVDKAFNSEQISQLTSYAGGKRKLKRILPLLPRMSRIYFSHRLDLGLTSKQSKILLGLLYKDVEFLTTAGIDKAKIRQVVNHVVDAILPLLLPNSSVTLSDSDGCPVKKQRN